MNKVLILIHFLCLSSLALASSNEFESWNFLEKSKQFSLLQHKSLLNTYIAISKRYDESVSEFLQDKSQLKLDQLISERRKAMSLVGVTQWKADKKEWIENLNIIKISGSYKDHKGIQVEFLEYHSYQPKEVLQILLTTPNISSIKDTEQLIKTLSAIEIMQ